MKVVDRIAAVRYVLRHHRNDALVEALLDHLDELRLEYRRDRFQFTSKDIAFLRPGQPAMVKFTAYDFSTYGGLDAKLEHIGADSITDERGNTFFLVRVRTSKSSLGANLPIIPGMVAEVDIITGKKSILSYLLKPVLRAKQAALTER